MTTILRIYRKKDSRKNHLVVVPPGKGKTRITMAIALLLKKRIEKVTNVVVVWPNEFLMNQDAAAWSEAQNLFSELYPGAELKRAVGMKAAERISNKESIILVDEADKLLVDDAEEPPKNFKACIGFTATIPSGTEGKVVQDRLRKFRVEIWNNFGYKNDGLNVDAEVSSIEEFFQTAEHGAKLVFCSARQMFKVE